MDIRRGTKRVCRKPESGIHAFPRGTAEYQTARNKVAQRLRSEHYISDRASAVARCDGRVAPRQTPDRKCNARTEVFEQLCFGPFDIRQFPAEKHEYPIRAFGIHALSRAECPFFISRNG